MEQRKDLVTIKGNKLTLLGKPLKVGDNAPDAEVLDNDLNPVKISSLKGKICVIVTVPSLDTPVCDTEAKRFNGEAAKLGKGVAILTVSMDLPFAQKRWCASQGIENVKTLSDHKEAALGSSYGVLIKELRLLARAIHVLDKEGVVRYVQLVKEVTDEPDYDEVLKEIRKLI